MWRDRERSTASRHGVVPAALAALFAVALQLLVPLLLIGHVHAAPAPAAADEAWAPIASASCESQHADHAGHEHGPAGTHDSDCSVCQALITAKLAGVGQWLALLPTPEVTPVRLLPAPVSADSAEVVRLPDSRGPPAA
jgi:hypothetical protein